MELGELHSISIDVLAVWNAIVFIFIALALVLGLLIIFFLIVTTLVQERWVAIVQDVLGMRSNFPQSFDEALSRTVDLGISIV